MATALTLSPSQIDSLADKLDSLDLTVAEQAALIAALRTGDSPEYVMTDPADKGKDVSEWSLPTPGEGLRSAFQAGAADEVSGFAAANANSVSVSVSVGWSAANA